MAARHHALPQSTYVPRQSRTTHSEILSDEICIYEWTAKRVHALNATAARVWALCDGTRSVAEIAETLRREIGLHADEVVGLAVAQFSEAGLLEAQVPAGPLALSRRRMVKRLGLTAAMLPVVSSIAAPSALEAASGPLGNLLVFTYTGASQTFVVPAGVTQITVDALGASNTSGPRTFAGFGGRVIATLPVTASETLTVTVGGAGDDLTGLGFNGGGPSGFAGGLFGRGGGASDIRRGSTRILVAGGAGGWGGAASSFGPGQGGDGGGLTGAPGAAPPTNPLGGGGGGTQTDGGTGGAAGLSATAGTAGISGVGGTGGSGSGTTSFGGGGGGGYFPGGGGGGDSSTSSSSPFGMGAGGGGGSSYTDPAATNVTHVQGVRFGAGQVTISW